MLSYIQRQISQGAKMIEANSGMEERDKIRTWLQIGIFLMVAAFFIDWLIRRPFNTPVK